MFIQEVTAARPTRRHRARASRAEPPGAQGGAAGAGDFAPFADASPQERRILDAALDLFVERGYHATTIPEIARRAGLAAGTIYLYFPGKEQLVTALLTRVRGALARELAEALPRPRGTRAEFEALWAVFARFALSCERALAFCDLHHHTPYAGPEASAVWDPAKARLRAHFAAGRRAGLYRDLPPDVLRAVVAGTLLGVHKFARAGELVLSAGLLDEAREMAWRAVTRQGPPQKGRTQCR